MTDGLFGFTEPKREYTISKWPESSGVKLKVGEQWVDITDLGDILIRAGEELNAVFKPATTGAGDDE